jgi:hypothetical protein
LYPYDLSSLLQALKDAQLQSFNHGLHVVIVVTGRHSQVIRRYEHGREAWSVPGRGCFGEDEDGPPG